ncbi:MAG TPA: mechanosensitive ion channel family protein [Propionibacteriaceae bacterium]|nr:mechanosensitive ion channel family protein [Propionibacteriaceae bacterium]
MQPLELVWVWPTTLIQLAVLIAVAAVLRWAIQSVIRRIVAASVDKSEHRFDFIPGRAGRILASFGGERQPARAKTLGALLANTASFTIATIAILTALSMVGIPMGPILASAGIGGVALGFGAQSLVRDLLSGLFMIAEDQYGVGDLITVGDITGTVEDTGLRVTRVRDASGLVWYVRNGDIAKVGNHSQGWASATVDIPVHYTSDAAQVVAVLETVVTELDNDPDWADQLLDTPTVLGVESIIGSAMTFRMSAKCVAKHQSGVQRELRERAKVALDAAGVRGPA